MSFLSHYMGEAEYEPEQKSGYKQTKLFTTVKIIKKSNISRCKDTKKSWKS